MEEVDKEISEMKLSLNARARVVAESYLTAASIFSIHQLSALTRIISSIRDGSDFRSVVGFTLSGQCISITHVIHVP
jgi:hypothetical protein